MDPSLIRIQNSRIVAVYLDFDAPPEAPITVMCECPAADCNEMVQLRIAEFRERERSGAFVLAPGHTQARTATECGPNSPL